MRSAHGRTSPGWLLFLAPPPLSERGKWALVDWSFYGLALALNLSFLSSVAGVGGSLVAAALLTGVAFAAVQAKNAPLKWLARLVLGLAFLFFIYEAAAFGWLLGWTTDAAGKAAVFGLGGLSLASIFRHWRASPGAASDLSGLDSKPSRHRRLPIFPAAAALGLWSTLCLLGWHAEDGVVHCDDYFRVQGQQGVWVVVPSSEKLRDCAFGQSILLSRYPRRVWEDAESKRFVMTTQKGIRSRPGQGELVAEELEGAICEARLGHAPHRCVGEGKAQPILESGDAEHLFVLGWGHRPESGGRGRIMTVSRQEPLSLISETATPGSFGEGFYDPKLKRFYLVGDECEEILPVNEEDRSFLKPIPGQICPGETRFDPQSQKGVFCGGGGPLLPVDGQAYAAVAFRSEPFEFWLLAPSKRYPRSWLTMTWACDLDASQNIAWVASATLGRLQLIDFESGDVMDEFSIPIGIRTLRYDPSRGWLFLGDFLRGRLLAVDAETGEYRGSWFVGHFLRSIELAREGGDVLVTSNVGVIRVSPDFQLSAVAR